MDYNHLVKSVVVARSHHEFTKNNSFQIPISLSNSIMWYVKSQVAQMVKASVCNAGDSGSIPGSGRSPGEESGNPLQYSCLENPMDGGAWSMGSIHFMWSQ